MLSDREFARDNANFACVKEAIENKLQLTAFVLLLFQFFVIASLQICLSHVAIPR